MKTLSSQTAPGVADNILLFNNQQPFKYVRAQAVNFY